MKYGRGQCVFLTGVHRDSEVQTDPYSPEFVVLPGSRPELLTLANLCYGELIKKFECHATISFKCVSVCM